MTIGAGKYDEECTQVREATGARGVVMIVFDGSKGSGFSVQTWDMQLLETLPDLLEGVAKQIRADHMRGRL
jgi:hypothetical protein